MSESDTLDRRPIGEPPAEPPNRLGWRLGLARLAILWEGFWPTLWPALAAIGIFLLLALFEIFDWLPGWLHAAILALLAVGLVLGLYRAARLFRLPGTAAARRRIERASGLEHRPLSALADRLAAGGDPATAALWARHRARMAEAATGLRIGVPAAGLAARDPYALRGALVLLLLIGIIGAGTQWDSRLWRAMTPSFHSTPAGPPPSLDLWVTPPDYTGLPPQFLQRDYRGAAIAVPTGSTLLAQAHGGRKPPRLLVDKAATAFTAIDGQNFKVEAKLTQGSLLTV